MTDQTFFQNCAQTLATLTSQAAENFIAAIVRDDRSGSTKNEKINFILDVETAATGINEIPFSKGHKTVIGKYEYFIRNNNLYRAPMIYPVMPDGYRCGRWQTKDSLTDSYLEMIKVTL